MNLFDVLTTIREAGGRVVVVEDDDLRAIVPAGVLTEEAAAVLKEHKQDLLKILPSGEREAIQWVEDLPPAEAEAVVDTACREWDEIVSEAWPEPCGQCGASELWQNALGRWRCIKCDPPTQSIKALNRAGRIRRRHKIKGN